MKKKMNRKNEKGLVLPDTVSFERIQGVNCLQSTQAQRTLRYESCFVLSEMNPSIVYQFQGVGVEKNSKKKKKKRKKKWTFICVG